MDGSDPANLDGVSALRPFLELRSLKKKELIENEQTKWGGITMKDMILSSYGGFVKNGNKNGFVSTNGHTRELLRR